MRAERGDVMIFTGENQRTRRKTCPSATLSTTNPTWTDPRVNLDLHSERPANDGLRHGTASSNIKIMSNRLSISSTDCLVKIIRDLMKEITKKN
jgi:hypothetical protein